MSRVQAAEVVWLGCFYEPWAPRLTGFRKHRKTKQERTQGRDGGKGELLLVVMAARKCTMGSCVSKVKRDARALLVSLRQTKSLTCS